MPNTDFQFLVEIHKAGAPLAQAPVPGEFFGSAVEWALFSAFRRGALPPVSCERPDARFEPVWDPAAGAPYIDGFRVRLPARSAGGPRRRGARPADFVSGTLPVEFFRDRARLLAGALVEEEKLERGAVYAFRVLAFEIEAPRALATGHRGGIQVEDVAVPLPLHESSLAAFLEGSASRGRSFEGEMPVFLPQHVLDETAALKTAAGDVETGGVLIGHLRQDPGAPEIFVEITDQIPAAHTQATATRLTFTKETWATVRATIKLRGRGEVCTSWWHSHPASAPSWCGRCEPARWKHCPLARTFFSAEDCAIQKEIYPRGYSTALVVGDTPNDDATWSTTHALFGWHQGMVVERGFNVITSQGGLMSTAKGGHHATTS